MDSELQEEIDRLFEKYTNDLKSRITKVIIRHEKRLVKQTIAAHKTTKTQEVPSTRRRCKQP